MADGIRIGTNVGEVGGMKTGQIRHLPLVERFWAQVDVRGPDDCWEWTGAGDRYGSIKDRCRSRGAHRVSFEIHFGKVPTGMHVCHRCDNKKCVNPRHLFAGTHQANMNDKVAKGRQHHPAGEQHPLSRLTWDDVRAIRASTETGVALAARYGVSRPTISNIRNGTTWRTMARAA